MNGMEILMRSLRGMIPEHIWQAVETNITKLGAKAQGIEDRLTAIELRQQEILDLLKGNHHPLDYPNKLTSEELHHRTNTLIGSAQNGEPPTP